MANLARGVMSDQLPYFRVFDARAALCSLADSTLYLCAVIFLVDPEALVLYVLPG